MNPILRRAARYLIPAAILTMILIVAALSVRQPAVSAGKPPPDVPDFVGEPFTATLNHSEPLPLKPVEVSGPQADWTVVFEADFEDVNWDNQWFLNLSQNGGPYKWGTEAIQNVLDPASQRVAWGVGTGSPELNPATQGYPADVNSWLIAGPFDFSDAIDARLTFQSYFEADTGDVFRVGVSTDGSTFAGTENNGGSGSWSSSGMNLTDKVGAPTVYFAFAFISDDSANPDDKLGVLLDNVMLSVQYTNKAQLPYVAYGFTPTPAETATPIVSPTPTREPNSNYNASFTNTIVPWEARRWSDGTDYVVRHRDDCDEGNRCGFLELEVKNGSRYVIASPLIQGRTPPYNIETQVRLMPKGGSDFPHDQDQYGIIFGGDWNGQPCPSGDNNTCFNQYYEFRVRYRENGGDWFVEFKLKKVTGHDGDNQNEGPDLINWKKVGVNIRKFVEWDITVRENGDIDISANGTPVGHAEDTEFLNNPYFGLEARTGPNVSSRAKFDYFKLDWN